MKTGRQPLEGRPLGPLSYHKDDHNTFRLCILQAVSRGHSPPLKNAPAGFISTAARRKGKNQIQALRATLNLVRGARERVGSTRASQALTMLGCRQRP